MYRQSIGNTRWAVAFLAAMAAASTASLVLDADYLGRVLPGGLPLGNLLAAVALSSLACIAFFIAPSISTRRFAAVALVATVAWLPLSVLLAGNLVLNFSGGPGSLWLAMSGIALALACTSLAWSLAACLKRWHKADRT